MTMCVRRKILGRCYWSFVKAPTRLRRLPGSGIEWSWSGRFRRRPRPGRRWVRGIDYGGRGVPVWTDGLRQGRRGFMASVGRGPAGAGGRRFELGEVFRGDPMLGGSRFGDDGASFVVIVRLVEVNSQQHIVRVAFAGVGFGAHVDGAVQVSESEIDLLFAKIGAGAIAVGVGKAGAAERVESCFVLKIGNGAGPVAEAGVGEAEEV